ncbi:MAG: hypothetical protein IJN63_06865 [Clostridia bacterium]|nr:hypothetical protein [Clostridia bacterium]
MKSYLLHNYKNRCKNEFDKYGFNWHGNNAYRVVNDVFQSFCLHRSVSGDSCTVEFITVPLCIGQYINKSYCGPNHLKKFENEGSWFEYDKNDDKSMEECVSNMIGYMQRYLIPFFEASTNAYDAYYANLSFQRDHYKDGIFWGDPWLFYLSMKANLYCEAEQHLTAWKCHIIDAYECNKIEFERIGKKLPDSYVSRIRNDLDRIEFWQIMINNADFDYFAKLMSENEIIALQNLGMI